MYTITIKLKPLNNFTIPTFSDWKWDAKTNTLNRAWDKQPSDEDKHLITKTLLNDLSAYSKELSVSEVSSYDALTMAKINESVSDEKDILTALADKAKPFILINGASLADNNTLNAVLSALKTSEIASYHFINLPPRHRIHNLLANALVRNNFITDFSGLNLLNSDNQNALQQRLSPSVQDKDIVYVDTQQTILEALKNPQNINLTIDLSKLKGFEAEEIGKALTEASTTVTNINFTGLNSNKAKSLVRGLINDVSLIDEKKLEELRTDEAFKAAEGDTPHLKLNKGDNVDRINKIFQSNRKLQKFQARIMGSLYSHKTLNSNYTVMKINGLNDYLEQNNIVETWLNQEKRSILPAAVNKSAENDTLNDLNIILAKLNSETWLSIQSEKPTETDVFEHSQYIWSGDSELFYYNKDTQSMSKIAINNNATLIELQNFLTEIDLAKPLCKAARENLTNITGHTPGNTLQIDVSQMNDEDLQNIAQALAMNTTVSNLVIERLKINAQKQGREEIISAITKSNNTLTKISHVTIADAVKEKLSENATKIQTAIDKAKKSDVNPSAQTEALNSISTDADTPTPPHHEQAWQEKSALEKKIAELEAQVSELTSQLDDARESSPKSDTRQVAILTKHLNSAKATLARLSEFVTQRDGMEHPASSTTSNAPEPAPKRGVSSQNNDPSKPPSVQANASQTTRITGYLNLAKAGFTRVFGSFRSYGRVRPNPIDMTKAKEQAGERELSSQENEPISPIGKPPRASKASKIEPLNSPAAGSTNLNKSATPCTKIESPRHSVANNASEPVRERGVLPVKDEILNPSRSTATRSHEMEHPSHSGAGKATAAERRSTVPVKSPRSAFFSDNEYSSSELVIEGRSAFSEREKKSNVVSNKSEEKLNLTQQFKQRRVNGNSSVTEQNQAFISAATIYNATPSARSEIKLATTREEHGKTILAPINFTTHLEERELRLLQSEEGLKLTSSSGMAFNFSAVNGIPKAVLSTQNLMEGDDPYLYQQRVAQTIMDMIDNVLGKGGVVNIKTSDPYKAAIATLYINHLKEITQDDFPELIVEASVNNAEIVDIHPDVEQIFKLLGHAKDIDLLQKNEWYLDAKAARGTEMKLNEETDGESDISTPSSPRQANLN